MPVSVLPFSIDYFKYHVLGYESAEAASNFTITDPKVLAQYVAMADKTNPGGSIADDHDLSPFFNRGGKLMHYVGTHDRLIPYGSVSNLILVPAVISDRHHSQRTTTNASNRL
jgi:hypothetical protein